MNDKKKHKVFVNAAISPQFIADAIARHSSKTTIGAHDIFLGQVRGDEINGKIVQAIDYSAYEEMAEEKFHEIRKAAFEKFDLICMHIYHSIGKVKAGEISLFVFTSSMHRAIAFDACRWVVEEIKASVPIFGKEMFEDETYSWKENIK
ncbi:MAG: molybdenum cofactor biosynthesis protein MoaE [Bacteroidetes bacterium]|nr:molybdenum cofactor biosynthesis protein MoaE [Bacteroidota bacterium]